MLRILLEKLKFKYLCLEVETLVDVAGITYYVCKIEPSAHAAIRIHTLVGSLPAEDEDYNKFAMTANNKSALTSRKYIHLMLVVTVETI